MCFTPHEAIRTNIQGSNLSQNTNVDSGNGYGEMKSDIIMFTIRFLLCFYEIKKKQTNNEFY